MWRQLTAAFAVDRLIFAPRMLGQEKPEEFGSIPEALLSLQGEPVFLIPGEGVDLVSFEHPENAAYVFGNAVDSNLRWAANHKVVSIRTPNPVDFFGLDAAAIVLYDRMVKRGY